MAKLKGFVAVILTLALITAGACFPKAVSMLLDWRNNGSAAVNPISSIRFEIAKDIPTLGKLALLSKLDSSIDLPEYKATMSPEEVMDAVYEGIQPYVDAQLIVYSEQEVEMHPSMLFQADGNQDLQGIVWFVNISGDPSNFTYLQLLIDDETGKILTISYTYEEPDAALVGTEAMIVFAEIYFNGLGIPEYTEYIVPDLEYAYVGDDANAIRYRFADAVYGDVNVDLYVHGHGFYMDFPSM